MMKMRRFFERVSSVIPKSSPHSTSVTPIKFNSLRTHNDCEVTRHADDTLSFETPAVPWGYCFDLPFHLPDSDREYSLQITATIRSGEFGVGLANENLQEIRNERYLTAAPMTQIVTLPVPTDNNFRRIIIRSGERDSGCSVEEMSVALVNRFEQSVSVPVRTMQRFGSIPDQIGLDQWINILRTKWIEIPYTASERTRVQDVLAADDAVVLNYFINASTTTASSPSGFEIRGWYHELYRDTVKGKKVLEIGSGIGVDAIYLAKNGATVTCLDIVEENLQLIQRIAQLSGVSDHVKTHYFHSSSSLSDLEKDFDIIWAVGSLINLPFSAAREECKLILQHLKPGGRWIELAYPKERWVREGQMPLDEWGDKTDGVGTPWMEWYDLNKLLDRMNTGRFKVLLSFNYHNDDFNWFDLVLESQTDEIKVPQPTNPLRGFVYTLPRIPNGALLAITHSDRPLDKARVHLSFLQERYRSADRLPPKTPLQNLSHARSSSPYLGAVTLWTPETDDLSSWTLVAHFIPDYKPQHARWMHGKLWVLGTEQLDVWRLDESRDPTEWVKEHEFTDPWLAGAHTLFEDENGNIILSASGSDSILIIDASTFKVLHAQRMPESLYGHNYSLDREDSVVEHFVPNDLQTTHVNCASPWQGGIAVSTLIQGAIGVFRGQEYREITRGFIGCHGVRADVTNPEQLYFCDSAVGTLNLIDGTGRLLSRCNLHSSWLHDAQQIEGDFFAVAISDRNVVEIVNRVTGETVGVIDGKPFGLTTQFISWSE